MSVILGLNAYHPGASAALVIDGIAVAAIAEERLNRVKYYGKFPAMAVAECLRMGGLTIHDVDAIAVGRDSSANLAQKLQYTLKNPSKLLNLVKIKAKSDRFDDLRTSVAKGCGVDPTSLNFRQYNVEHHLAHTASAFFASRWDYAAGITIDGSGDFVTCMMSECRGDTITPVHRIFVPHSLGSLYTAVGQFIGYGKYGDEGKVMGLAPLGEDTYADFFADIVRLTDNGIELNPSYFLPFGSDQGVEILEGGEMNVARHYSELFLQTFGEPTPRYATPSKRDQDLAFGLQKTFERAYMHLLNLLYAKVPSPRIVMAGGCALNSVANGKLFGETPFQETFIQPAAGDEGLALGAALYVSRSILREKQRWVMHDAYLGPEFSENQIRDALERAGVAFERHDRDALLDQVAEGLAASKVVGWFQGRMEWGPRALGNRSILAHPGAPNMKDILNARIKHREPFRPFAPAVLAERQAEIFSHAHPSPFMLHVYDVRPEWRDRLSAVTHVDNTGRLQSVAREENPLYYDLIQTFDAKTGIPVILNTSFNENEPIVCKPEEAIACFQRTRMDMLAIGPFICRKEANNAG